MINDFFIICDEIFCYILGCYGVSFKVIGYDVYFC